MKKFIPIIVICMATVCSFAAETYKFPGWKSTNIADLDKQISICEANKNVHSMAVCLVIKDFAQNGVPTTFDAYKAVIEKHVKYVIGKNGITDQATIERELNWAIQQIPLCRNEFLGEAYAYAQKVNDRYLISYIISTKVNIEPSVRYQKLVEYLTKTYDNQHVVERYTCEFIDIAIKASVDGNVDNTTVKKDFQKLNRLYSSGLIKNKEIYEPVVAKIRTILETL